MDRGFLEYLEKPALNRSGEYKANRVQVYRHLSLFKRSDNRFMVVENLQNVMNVRKSAKI